MKLFCYIFSLYFVLLSCLPCNDSEHVLLPPQPPQYAMNIEVQNHHNPDNHDNCNDLCSPFCTCACCGMTINLQATFNYTPKSQPIPLPIVSENFSYQSPHSNQYLQGVFQPPQVG